MNGETFADQYARVSQRPPARQLGAVPLVLPILEELGLCATVNQLRPSRALVDPGRLALILVLNRLLAPRPLSGIGEWAAQETVVSDLLEVAGEHLYDMRLGRALDALFPVLGELWDRLVASAIRQEGVDLAVLHWDLTSCFFAGESKESELARYGYSRDKRPATKQVNPGINVTGPEHVPVQYRVRPGNPADCTTPVANVEALIQFPGRSDLGGQHARPLIVSDRKRVTDEAVLACPRHGLTDLGPVPPGEKQTLAIIASVPDREWATSALAYRPRRRAPAGHPFVPYRGVWRTISFRHHGQTVTDRALVVWSAAKERLDVDKRKTLLKRMLDGLAQIRAHLNQRQYRRRDYVVKRLARVGTGTTAALIDVALSGDAGALRLHFAINRSKVQAAQAVDGKSVLATNAAALTADTALATYQEQDAVAKAMALLKGPLRVRPFFVQTDARIQGLVFVNLVALLVRAILGLRLHRAGLALSVEQALAAFAALQVVEVGFADGSTLRRVAAPTSRHRQIPG
ncbi:MAG TPA: DUF4277 domain-containing protein, partial [Chloroflexota bacterium]|nr:DUF4277 domain-containing protein [Chloroflexota bacterium]